MPDDEGQALYRAALAAGQAVARAGAQGVTPGDAPRGAVLEIGTYCGKSTLYLAAAALEMGTVCFSVDHHRGSEEMQAGWEHHDPSVVDPTTGRIDTLPLARRTVAEAGLEDTIVLVVGPSTVVGAHWSTPLALLFIDGGHGGDVAWADYLTWSPKVAPGGLLAIHDVFPDPADGGRPPYELYCAAQSSGRFDDCPELACGSLRVLRHREPVPVGSDQTGAGAASSA
jgi:hypothetical protein